MATVFVGHSQQLDAMDKPRRQTGKTHCCDHGCVPMQALWGSLKMARRHGACKFLGSCRAPPLYVCMYVCTCRVRSTHSQASLDSPPSWHIVASPMHHHDVRPDLSPYLHITNFLLVNKKFCRHNTSSSAVPVSRLSPSWLLASCGEPMHATAKQNLHSDVHLPDFCMPEEINKKLAF